jgi:hypothetical protein
MILATSSLSAPKKTDSFHNASFQVACNPAAADIAHRAAMQPFSIQQLFARRIIDTSECAHLQLVNAVSRYHDVMTGQNG